MKPVLILDSTPLGLIVQRRDAANAEKCRQWLKKLLSAGVRVIVPEIVNYELRRELLRLGKTTAIAQLAAFNQSMPDRFLPITTQAMDMAAELWAKVRRQGKPTAHAQALDVDVILAAQVLSAGINPSDFVVATSNVSHLSLLVSAAPLGITLIDRLNLRFRSFQAIFRMKCQQVEISDKGTQHANPREQLPETSQRRLAWPGGQRPGF